MKYKLFILYVLIVFNISALSACALNNSGFSKVNPLPCRTFEHFESKDEFKDFYRDEIILTTGIDKQRELVLTNLYNAQDFLSYLDIDIKIINRDSMMDLAEELKVDTFAGLYRPNNKEIILVGYDTDTSIHELGHAIYYQLLDNESKLASEAFYKKESGFLIDDYGMTSSEEFFAVAFTEYIYSPETLAKNCPNIYSLIQNMEEALKI